MTMPTQDPVQPHSRPVLDDHSVHYAVTYAEARLPKWQEGGGGGLLII